MTHSAMEPCDLHRLDSDPKSRSVSCYTVAPGPQILLNDCVQLDYRVQNPNGTMWARESKETDRRIAHQALRFPIHGAHPFNQENSLFFDSQSSRFRNHYKIGIYIPFCLCFLNSQSIPIQGRFLFRWKVAWKLTANHHQARDLIMWIMRGQRPASRRGAS